MPTQWMVQNAVHVFTNTVLKICISPIDSNSSFYLGRTSSAVSVMWPYYMTLQLAVAHQSSRELSCSPPPSVYNVRRHTASHSLQTSRQAVWSCVKHPQRQRYANCGPPLAIYQGVIWISSVYSVFRIFSRFPECSGVSWKLFMCDCVCLSQ